MNKQWVEYFSKHHKSLIPLMEKRMGRKFSGQSLSAAKQSFLNLLATDKAFQADVTAYMNRAGGVEATSAVTSHPATGDGGVNPSTAEMGAKRIAIAVLAVIGAIFIFDMVLGKMKTA